MSYPPGFYAPQPFVPGLAHAAHQPQAPGRPLTVADIGPGLIGRIVEVYWPDDTNPANNMWYIAKIESVNLQAMTACILYQNGETEMELPLLDIARDQHMRLLVV